MPAIVDFPGFRRCRCRRAAHACRMSLTFCCLAEMCAEAGIERASYPSSQKPHPCGFLSGYFRQSGLWPSDGTTPGAKCESGKLVDAQNPKNGSCSVTRVRLRPADSNHRRGRSSSPKPLPVRITTARKVRTATGGIRAACARRWANRAAPRPPAAGRTRRCRLHRGCR